MRKIVKLRKDFLKEHEIEFFDKFVKDFGMPPEFALAHMVKFFMYSFVFVVPEESEKNLFTNNHD